MNEATKGGKRCHIYCERVYGIPFSLSRELNTLMLFLLHSLCLPIRIVSASTVRALFFFSTKQMG